MTLKFKVIWTSNVETIFLGGFWLRHEKSQKGSKIKLIKNSADFDWGDFQKTCIGCANYGFKLVENVAKWIKTFHWFHFVFWKLPQSF